MVQIFSVYVTKKLKLNKITKTRKCKRGSIGRQTQAWCWTIIKLEFKIKTSLLLTQPNIAEPMTDNLDKQQ